MKKAKDSADAAAMGGDVVASGSSDSYDVFLSFTGPDIPLTIAGLLYRSMGRAGIRVFKDDEQLREGDKISGEILRAIDGAKIYIPIFSRNYASCNWCLRDLAAMVERKVKPGGGKTIIPIFYDVEPYDVRLLTSLYHKALMEHEKRFGSEKVKVWENALRKVASLPGWDMRSGSDDRIIEEIVEEVMLKLKVNGVHVNKLIQSAVVDHVKLVEYISLVECSP